VAGTLTDSNGGLGYAMWEGSPRALIATMLQNVPAATPSAAAKLLLRKLILTTAPPPSGRADGSFNVLRLNKLVNAGLSGDAADLALRVQAPGNLEITRAQADALLYSGRDADACGNTTARRFDSAEPFWVKLRAYCYALADDAAALDLTRAVMMEQGTADPAFMTLLDGMTGGMPMAPEALRYPDALHVRMLTRLNLPMGPEVATGLNLSASLIAAAQASNPVALRIVAAERALRAGVLPNELFGAILDLTAFTPQELEGAAARARTEPLMNALARLRAALKPVNEPDARAELIYTAFEIGEREGLLAQVSSLFAVDAAAILPDTDWSNWSDLMARGLLLANRSEAAERWIDILDRDAPGGAEMSDQLQLALALSAPDARRDAGGENILSELVLKVHPPAPVPEPPPPPDPTMPNVVPLPPPPPPPPEKPSQAVLTRATLDLGLLSAVGRAMSPEAQSVVKELISEPSPGRRPAEALMDRIDKAATAKARGEVALSVLAAMGREGARDLAPDVVVRLVRALKAVGIEDGARTLAQEALLLRRGAGAQPEG
jgi:hypothetical protein